VIFPQKLDKTRITLEKKFTKFAKLFVEKITKFVRKENIGHKLPKGALLAWSTFFMYCKMLLLINYYQWVVWRFYEC
jgi:hypothetical protein